MTSTPKTLRLKVSPEVAKVAAEGVPRETRLRAARGALPLPPRELVTALFFLAHGSDEEVRTAALRTFQGLQPSQLALVAAAAGTHPRVLVFIARTHLRGPAVMEALLENPSFPEVALLQVAAHAKGEVLRLVVERAERQEDVPGLLEALRKNPHLTANLRGRLEERFPQTGPGEKDEAASDEDGTEAVEEEEEGQRSKYQLALEMGVSEKIKMALTGDKEWRGLFLKDSNKLVSAAVLKNPRITDGEVLAVAKNKSSSEELIRLITLNNEWVKNSEIKKALIYHPKTPLPKALRYMNILTEKDLKQLAKSRGVSQVLVNNARRMLTAKQQNR